MAAKKRIVILGGGHAGVPCARRLQRICAKRDDVEIVLVSMDDAEVWHGLLPQILSGLVQPMNALVSLREVLPGVTIYPYEIKRIDMQARLVALSPGGESDDVVIRWDYLVLALGSVTNLSRFPGLVEHGFQTKTIGDIVHLRNHVIAMLERASVEPDPAERRRMLRFVVAGAGFAGVEFASQANEFLRTALRFYPAIAPDDIQVMLVSNGERILPAISKGLARRAHRYIVRHGIDVRLGVGVRSVTASAAELSTGEIIPTRTVIVTVGVAPNPLASELGVAIDNGRIVADSFCAVEGHPGVFAVGDNAAVPDPRTGKYCPQTFLYAMSQGECAADNIVATMHGKPLRRYAYRSIGELSFLSKHFAIAQLLGIPLEGIVATLIGRSFFLAYIPSWRRRLSLFNDWFLATFFPRDITQVQSARSDTIVPMRFGPGEVIVREGDPGNRFYIISEGECEVVRATPDGEELLEVLGPGRHFGEIALLHAVRRTATVRTRTMTKVLSIAHDEFGALVSHMPAFRDLVDTPRP